MRTPRQLVATMAATALAWASLTLVAAAPARADIQPPHDPATYYASAVGLTGNALALELHDIIDGNAVLPYTAGTGTTDVWDALSVLDADPNDGTKIVEFYSGDLLLAMNQCGSSCDQNTFWNREHTWPQSHGVDLDNDADAGTDLFHMRPTRPNTNSSRGDLDFDETVNSGGAVPGCPVVCQRDGNSFEPREAVKGDLARGLFYMAVRYNSSTDGAEGDLVLVDAIPSSGFTLGKLSTLVGWAVADPPDAREQWRNDKIDSDYQHNRNPFIDHPEWVCSIWGSANPTACSSTNQPPTATPQSVTTAEDTATAITLAGTDPESSPLTYAIASQPAHGSVNLAGGTATYTPATDYVGPDSFTFTVNDGTTTSASATVSITVTPVNDQPTVVDVGSEEAPIHVPRRNSKQVTLVGSDVDAVDTLTYAIVSQPSRGSVSVNGAVATYTGPNSSYTGGESFTYRVTDSAGAPNSQSAEAVVYLDIQASPSAPVPGTVSGTTDEDTPVVVTLTATDPDGDNVIYDLTTQPTKGSVNRVGNQVTYTPNANATGTDSFGWSASDGTTTVTATAGVTITPVNDPPVANAASTSTAEDTAKAITLTGSDVEGQALSYAIASQPSHGSVNLVGTQATYTPAANYVGPDSFTFTASDGVATSAPKAVSVTVTAVNDAPTATPQGSVTTAEDTATVITLAGTDIDGDTLSYAIATNPGHGVAVRNGNEVTYTPATDYDGPDTFTFTVSDGSATSAAATVSLAVTPVNDAPTADPLTKSGYAGTDLVIALGGRDVDSDNLTYDVVDEPQHGDVVVEGDQATYTPDPDWSGDDSFTYTASDAEFTSAPATVTITVANDPPSVDPTTLNVTAGSSVSQVLTTSDPDGDTVIITSATSPAFGSVTFTGAEVTYTPSVRSGSDSFTVTVSDGHGGTDSALVSVTITARTATLGVVNGPATRGKPVTTTITATGPAGPKPGGTVMLKNGGTILGAATLNAAGVATVTWTPTRTGLVGLVATYAGDSIFDPATSPSTSIVVAHTTPTFSFAGKVKAGKKGKVTVTMGTVAGVPPSGTLTLKVGTKTFTAVLKGGVATFKIGKVPSRKKLKVVATYGGDGQYRSGTAKKTYKTS